jgi:hypothetical protein
MCKGIEIQRFSSIVLICAVFPILALSSHEALGKCSDEEAEIKCGAIGTGELADGAVTTKKIRNKAITKAKLADGILGDFQLENGSVSTAKLADKAVTRAKLANRAVGRAQLKTNAVTSGKLNDGAVTSTKLGTNSVQRIHIAPSAVTASELAGNAVNSSKIADNTVTAADIGTDAVGSSELKNFIVLGTNISTGVLQTRSAVSDLVVTQITSNSVGAGTVITWSKDDQPIFAMSSTGGGEAGDIRVYNSSGSARAGMQGVTGLVWGDQKSFIVEDPTDSSRMIKYTSIEGPEAAIYSRGTAQLEGGWAVVDLPEHFTAMVDPESITVSLTPRAATSLGLAAIEVFVDRIEVWELQGGAGSYPFDYVVYGQRKGYEDYQVYLYRDPEKSMLRASLEGNSGPLDLADFPRWPLEQDDAPENLTHPE